MIDIESSENINNLLKNIPKAVLGKLSISMLLEPNQLGEIEVVVLIGENKEAVQHIVADLGGKFEDLGYGFAIVTITLDKLVKVAQSMEIKYLELPKSLFFNDLQSDRATCVDRVRSEYKLDGKGILVGFIDTGIDFTHPAFINEDGTTRIEYIYDLSTGGQVYNKEQINNALKQNDPFSVVPSVDTVEHGTHVAGIACAGGKNPGIAPKSSIIMVKSGRGQFSLSTNIMRGIKFIVDKSSELKMPLVINISMSTNDGAHNGTSLLEKYITTIAESERVTIVIAAGNEGDAAHHISGELKDINTIRFEVAEDETSVSINLYKSILPTLTLELIAPTGISSGVLGVKEGYLEGVLSGNRYSVYNTGPRPFDIIGEIGISLITGGNYILPGIWSIILRLSNEYQGRFEMWLPILEGLNKKTKFLQPTIDGTLGIPATASNVISVGSYDYLSQKISSFSGRGKLSTLGTEAKPSVVAPGENIMAPVPNKSYDKKSGTSMATPHVSGICALLMEWGVLRGNDPYLFGDRLKYYLISGARRSKRDVIYPNTSWGYGEVCAYESLSILKEVLNILNISGPERKEDKSFGNIFFRKPKKFMDIDIVETNFFDLE